MSRKVLIFLSIIVALLLIGEIGYIAFRERTPDSQLNVPSGSTAAVPSESTADAASVPAPTETGTAASESTAAPTETEPTETEPQEERFLLTFVGDCTLGSSPTHYNYQYSFIKTIGEDYDYPFRNVRQYFENDDFTIANLEGVFMDETGYSSKQFAFRGPTAYTQILTGSSVEAVTLANNHTQDYGEKGYTSTKDALDAAKVTYVEQNGSAIYTTESGLTIGMYAVAFNLDQKDMEKEIAELRKQGAEIIIVAIHWGVEGAYRPNANQVMQAHAAIDAGADIVYGHHPHVLQKIEEYGDGIIYYSLSNFSFGGNNYPQDLDTAVLQQEVIRDIDGTVRLGELTIIPASCSSLPVQNNFQPTPYEEGTKEYDRAMSKLDGTFKGGDLIVDYGNKETTATTPATQAPAETAPAPEATTPPAQAPAETAPPATQPPAATEAPATQPASPDVPDAENPEP